MTHARQRRTPRNLQSYWQIEAANVFLVPGLAFALGFPRHLLECVALLAAMASVAGFLVVGAAFWRGVDRRVRLHDHASIAGALNLAARVEAPMLVILGVASALTVAAWWSNGWTRAVIAATVLSVLALLEYVNYYHRQLQHFDHIPDLRRLLTGSGLKRSHMARELQAARRAAKLPGEGVPNQDRVFPLR